MDELQCGIDDGAPQRGISVTECSADPTLVKLGSFCHDPSATGGIRLSFEDAIQRGLRFNLGASTATNNEAAARGQRLAALSALLPNVNGVLSENVQQTYLPSAGITGSTLGLPSSTVIPAVTGQFHYYTAQGTLSQNAFDLTALHNLRSAKASETVAHLSARDAHELVVLAVGAPTFRRYLRQRSLMLSSSRWLWLRQATNRPTLRRWLGHAPI